MIKPTVGRVVWYRPVTHELDTNGADPLAAIVTAVESDDIVNLTVFQLSGVPTQRTRVPLVQEGGTKPQARSYCEWMPYQIGQAKQEAAAS